MNLNVGCPLQAKATIDHHVKVLEAAQKARHAEIDQEESKYKLELQKVEQAMKVLALKAGHREEEQAADDGLRAVHASLEKDKNLATGRAASDIQKAVNSLKCSEGCDRSS